MRRHGSAVDLGSGPRLAHALGDVEDDASEAVLVDPDLLVVRDLSDFAAQPPAVSPVLAEICESAGDVLPHVCEVLGQVGDDCAAVQRGTSELGHFSRSTVGLLSGLRDS